ncbi:MAG: endolytic transglycosylase MltG [Rikenellaceae bacterium]
MLRSFFWRVIIFSAVVLLVVAWGCNQFWGSAVREDCDIALSHKVLQSEDVCQVVDSLVLPHLRHNWAFNIYARHINLYERGVKGGYYRLRRGMSVIDVARMLKLGVQSPVRIIFNNARTAESLAGRISRQIDVDSVELLQAMRSPELSQEFGLTTQQMISIFIPNTYEVWWTITAEDFVRRMHREYEVFWNDDREAKRKALNLTRTDVSTLASIVYEESAKVDEYRRIAGVYINRLRRRMKLQADPTVKFAIGDFSIKRVLNQHLNYDSLYNTYRNYGLPPSPICVASIAALDAVLNYEQHNYLYFCARAQMDGYHEFESSYSAHLANARRYAAELNKMGL